MKLEYRILFDSDELNTLGSFYLKECGTKWMTLEQCLSSKFLNEKNARIVKREYNYDRIQSPQSTKQA